MTERSLDPAWLAQVTKANPMRLRPNGDIVLPPTFLDYTGALLTPKIPNFAREDGKPQKPKYSCTLVLQKGIDFTVLKTEMDKIYASKGCVRQMKTTPTGPKPIGPWMGQKSPLLPQGGENGVGLDKNTGEMKRGYTDGAFAIRVSSEMKPLITRQVRCTPSEATKGKPYRREEILPPAYDEIYSGVLVLPVINLYYYPVDKALLSNAAIKRGVGIGLRSAVVLSSTTPKWFESGGRPATLSDIADIDISPDSVLNFETGDGFAPPMDDNFDDGFASAAEFEDDDIPF